MPSLLVPGSCSSAVTMGWTREFTTSWAVVSASKVVTSSELMPPSPFSPFTSTV